MTLEVETSDAPSPLEMPTIILTHQQLYDRVWMTPLDALAKELGLSGRGLGTLCNRHDIPVPHRGWWAKKAPGHRVRQTPLPAPSAGLAASIGFTVSDKVEAEQSEAPQLHPLVAFEQQSKNGIDVPDDRGCATGRHSRWNSSASAPRRIAQLLRSRGMMTREEGSDGTADERDTMWSESTIERVLRNVDSSAGAPSPMALL